MPQTCKRRPARGGAAVYSLAGDGLRSSRFVLEHPDLDLSATALAARWVARRYRLPLRLATAVAELALLGGSTR